MATLRAQLIILDRFFLGQTIIEMYDGNSADILQYVCRLLINYPKRLRRMKFHF